jgi:hypothetical protein
MTTAASVTGEDVLRHLRETGTGPDRCRLVQDFLRGRPDASGEDVVRFLQESHVALGTVRKAGKFVFGHDWTIAADEAVPTDETRQLRAQVAELERQLQEATGRHRSLMTENQNLRAQIRSLNDQLLPLRAKAADAATPGQPAAGHQATPAETRAEPRAKGK